MTLRECALEETCCGLHLMRRPSPHPPPSPSSCPIVDSHEGVTHALRSSEYHDRDKQFYWMLELLGLRKVLIQDFSRLNFLYTLLSKRKLAWFVEQGHVDGWYDPRFPTLQGVLRRGMTLPALREFILNLGASKRGVEMEWDGFWATNRRLIDPIAPRYTAITTHAKVKLTLTPAPDGQGPDLPPADSSLIKATPLHPKVPEGASKGVHYGRELWLEGDDAALFKLGEKVTLMKLGNVIITALGHTGPDGRLETVTAHMSPDVDFKGTAKVTWLADVAPPVASFVPLTLIEFDYLITVPKLEEGDDFAAAVNPVTELREAALGEPAMSAVVKGDIIQLERRGFYRVDVPPTEGRPAVLFCIPDGKVKGLFDLAQKKVAQRERFMRLTGVIPPELA